MAGEKERTDEQEKAAERRRLERLKEIKEAGDLELALMKNIKNAMKDVDNSYEKRIASQEALNELLFTANNDQAKEVKVQQEFNEKLGLSVETNRENSKIVDRHLKAHIAIFKEKVKNGEATEDEIAKFKKIQKMLEKRKKTIDDIVSLEDEKVHYQKDSLKGIKALTTEHKYFKAAQMAALNPAHALLKLFTFMILQTIAVTKAYDTQRAELAKLTGGATQYNEALANSVYLGQQYALSAQEAMEGTAALIGGFTRISELSKEQISEFGALAGALKQFGFDATKMMDTTRMVFQMSGRDSANLAKELFEVGEALGPTMAKQISEQFGPAMSKLAAYTKDRAIKVLKGLAAQARATGLEISKLLQFAEQFDTFEGAATAVGRLNSILGGDYLNSVQMLYATEKQRIDMVRKSIVMSGRLFSDMSRFEKKALANAAGISDVAEALKLLGTKQEVFDDMAAKATKAGLTVDQFKERVAATKDITKKWAAILGHLTVVMTPIVTSLHWILDSLIKIFPATKTLGGGILRFIGILGALTIAVLLVKVVFWAMGKGLAMLGFAFPKAASGAMGFMKSMSAMGKATGGAIAGAAKLVAVMLLLALGITSVAASIYFMSSAFKSLREAWSYTPDTPEMKSLRILSELTKSNEKQVVLREIKEVYLAISKVTPASGIAAFVAVEALQKVLVSAQVKKSQKKELKIKVEVDVKSIAALKSTIEKQMIETAKKIYKDLA